ncbi:hypothetical protein FHS15_002067 [Paenibacillus castaneae]|nr:hypothetical protein [Paenibacillus castaneae]
MGGSFALEKDVQVTLFIESTSKIENYCYYLLL